ncbi:MAG: hypothetical protein M3270_05995 [Thermoproteota archaeon]|nr:hypothetical protein [Thermoproteota archaeon]
MNTSLIGALISILLWITVIAKIEICRTEFKGFENWNEGGRGEGQGQGEAGGVLN